jgi:heat shock protein HslJ/uncharacterized membrane protein
MKKTALLGLFLCVLMSCKTEMPKATVVQETQSKKKNIIVDENPYFKANGNEPFWNLTISEKEIVFKSLLPGFENFTMPQANPIQAMDANVKRYHLETESGIVTIQIQQGLYSDTMSDQKWPYSVTVEMKRNADKEYKTFKGGGQYITDIRLYDIWVLEQINGKKAVLTDYNGNFPRIEINSTKNEFYGFSGCNSINGKLFFERGLLRFVNGISTLMACPDGNKEYEFMTALQSATTYSIANMRLTLSNPSGVLLVFKKVD